MRIASTASSTSALAWYARAAKLAPESSAPGFAIAQAQFDAGKLADANHTFTNLQKYAADTAAAEHDLGVIAFAQNRADDAAWYLRKAAREAPRTLETRRAVVAAELARKDTAAALAQVEPALAYWPDDPVLHYLAGIAHALAGDPDAARAELARLDASRRTHRTRRDRRERHDRARLEARARAAVGRHRSADRGARAIRGARRSDESRARHVPERHPRDARRRRQGTARARQATGELPGRRSRARLGRCAESARDRTSGSAAISKRRSSGSCATTSSGSPRACCRTRASRSLRRSIRSGSQLADAGELRAELGRGIAPELRAIGCSEKLIAAAVLDPNRYHVIEEDKPDTIPKQTAPRAKPRTTFFVDNTGCPDPVAVWIDGKQLGEVAPGRRSALVADGGERSLCLLGPGAAQCGDRGTVRQIYLHDGWSVSMRCP